MTKKTKSYDRLSLAEAMALANNSMNHFWVESEKCFKNKLKNAKEDLKNGKINNKSKQEINI